MSKHMLEYEDECNCDQAVELEEELDKLQRQYKKLYEDYHELHNRILRALDT